VLAEIATVRPLPPVTAPLTPERRRRFRPVALVAAAAAVIALGGGVVWQSVQDETTQQAPTLSADQQLQQVLEAKDAEHYTKQLPGGVTVTITRSTKLNKAVLETSGMDDLPSDKVYEMWFAQEGEGMVPAGLMEDSNGTFLMEGDAAEAIGAGITVEPAGGSTEPTLPPVTTLSFENA
jgi:anti-sigma-K factor RskA